MTVVSLVVVVVVIAWPSALVTEYTDEKLLLDFRARLFGHDQHLSCSYHDTQGTGRFLVPDSERYLLHSVGRLARRWCEPTNPGSSLAPPLSAC